ncbi:MAG: hypothetical protein GEU79_08965 [Acidimicrobiia bacterium]|nr:hypothetical protein [Acidimicrobiia bacterium]
MWSGSSNRLVLSLLCVSLLLAACQGGDGETGGSLAAASREETTSEETPDSECLAREGDLVEIDGPQDDEYWRDDIETGMILDATNATWDGYDEDGEPIPWSITLDGEPGACWYGGSWTGAWDETDPDVTWEDPYHHSGFLTIRIPEFLVEGVRVDNQGDGIRMEERGADFHIRAVYLTDIHDDCIENDFMHGGVLEDSLLDGCYVGFSAAQYEGNDSDGSDNRWVMENNLIRMEPQPTPYRGPSPGHGAIFKWTVGGPQVVFRDNIIRVDQPPNHGHLGIHEELDLVECENNTVVWGGEGPYPEPLPDCFTVTTDLSVWDEAVEVWHDQFGQTAPAA